MCFSWIRNSHYILDINLGDVCMENIGSNAPGSTWRKLLLACQKILRDLKAVGKGRTWEKGEDSGRVETWVRCPKTSNPAKRGSGGAAATQRSPLFLPMSMCLWTEGITVMASLLPTQAPGTRPSHSVISQSLPSANGGTLILELHPLNQEIPPSLWALSFRYASIHSCIHSLMSACSLTHSTGVDGV